MKKLIILLLLLLFSPIYSIVEELQVLSILSVISYVITHPMRSSIKENNQNANKVRSVKEELAYDFLIEYYLLKGDTLNYQYIKENKDNKKVLLNRLNLIANKIESYNEFEYDSIKFILAAFAFSFTVVYGERIYDYYHN